MSKHSLALTALAIGAVAATVTLLTWPMISESYERPDPATMRTHVISRMTDQQLLALKADAVAQFEQHKKQQQDRAEKYWRERSARAQDCEANPAEKLRRPNGCNEGLPITFESIGKPMMGLESPDAIFETELLGICRYIDNVRKAKQIGCLPD